MNKVNDCWNRASGELFDAFIYEEKEIRRR